ncbi:hypothetical protein A3D83_02170 [Candidatus Daviesbacteria bacterium RIFCSPHIGHO2_02_FULL_41_10]|uniref:Glycosyltransferase RgtA/B/C/D-like domain-containing protein n=2 Tax=Candidatus Daviesiibacteriota TaxID=1752718 RepID=A0A1F5ITG9_9BACT|nr:MAG: hypothetical protein A2871_03330 [Candidatus Daviesbacteria bacterium RIFCSPHIGHO2_01_FULL_41_23]OGE32435.1 MAG: hypothetical protein A3D83_02170 [Candidatus Daviesbacteria bacterium RIFCSPHIGHO2_02_FULL_41_10]OGE61955.1 MAG: hypothetical protein A2967_03145 [Candidatus Daviesbacteria bacterium RIFCSPLOWO2_01_FULL_41_32]
MAAIINHRLYPVYCFSVGFLFLLSALQEELMFQLAFLIGLFSYIIFFTGILGFLNKGIILLSVVSFLLLACFIFKKSIFDLKTQINLKRWHFGLTALFIVLILIQAGINLLGALGPELGFDALWYHLTMPKIYLQSEKIFYIGGHLYYSAMPQLTEMYYLVGLALGNEIVAKIIHFAFGILSLIALYKMARIFLSVRDSLLTTLIFYSNLVVGWMSITAYIDLARTFFEVMALWAFVYFVKSGKLRWISISAAMVGFAVSTKVLSISSIILYLLLLIYIKFSAKLNTRRFLKLAVAYTGIALAVAIPWLLYSYLNTGNPIYPVFSSGFNPNSVPMSFNLIQLFKQGIQIFLLSPDPISPVYLISLPLIGWYIRKNWFKKNSGKTTLIIKLLIIYVLFNIVSLYLTPIESSGRFILPYLPAFSLLFILLIKNLNSKFLYNFSVWIIIIISISSIAYRGMANKRFIPYLLGKITPAEFMAKNMEFQVGNFFDLDGYFQKTIKPDDKVLIYGISNLYYVNFPYIHSSRVKEGDKFNYILVKDMGLPGRFQNWKLVYQNPVTKVKLYTFHYYDK